MTGGPRARYVHFLDEVDQPDAHLLGGKGAGLVRMTAQGLPIPPGVVITTEACRQFMREGGVPADLFDEVDRNIERLEHRLDRRFGGGPTPLLVSVRSGAAVSMPGMMDTILNLGLNRDAAVALAQASGSVSFMLDVLVRFHRMYAEIALGAMDEFIGDAAEEFLAGISNVESSDPGRLFDRLWRVCDEALEFDVGTTVPLDPHEQLHGAIEAVLRSWQTPRAVTYRDYHKIPHDLGTAVVVQSMVFGNLGHPSGTGVAFTRNPVTGSPTLYGEYLEGGQGEDVVAGTVDPQPINDLADRHPELFSQLQRLSNELERTHHDILDIEFTIERGDLYLLQVRSAKRTAEAAVRVAGDFVNDAEMDLAGALGSVSVDQVRQIERARFDEDAVAHARAEGQLLTTAVGASPGEVHGVLVVDADRAVERAATGESVILARPTTSPVDLHGMLASQGILTVKGGTTSHAAVVARAVGKACVVGCGAIQIDEEHHRLTCGERTLAEGDEISIDGSTGEVFLGALPITHGAASSPDLAVLLEQADAVANCSIMGRVTTVEQVQGVLERGATGVATSVGHVLTTTGDLDAVIEVFNAQRDARRPDFRVVRRLVAEQFGPLLAAARKVDVGIRTIDFLSSEAGELLQQTELLNHHPRLAVPLGIPEFVGAQIAGVGDAISAAGFPGRAYVSVRHVSDPKEASAIRDIAAESGVDGSVGVYVTSPRGALLAPELARYGDVLWVQLSQLQAAMFGLSSREYLSGEPLDDYVRRGMLTTDPRTALDETMDVMLIPLAKVVRDTDCTVGMRLSGDVSEQIVDKLYAHGFRLYAVDAAEVRPLRLALGKAAATAS